VKVEMIIPDLSTTGGTVKVVNWLIEVGQKIERGQPLLEVETDKATVDVEAYVTGTLDEILAPPGTDVDVGQVIAVLSTQEGGQPFPGSQPIYEKHPLEAKQGPPSSQAVPASQAPPSEPKKPMGMFARNRQTQSVQSLVSETPTRKAEINMTMAQRVVAQRMAESKSTIPHFYLQTTANAGPAAGRRGMAVGEKPAWDAFFVFAVGKALKKYNRMCVSFIDGKLKPQEVDSVGVAVDLDGDLYVVRIANPADKSPEGISAEIQAWVQRIKDRDPEAMKNHPGNLTITNLGAAGVESFIAVINPPEAAILAIGKIAPTVVAVDGQITIQERVSMTLSVDHRIVNGRYAADFLADIVRELENL
jgi:pyruvate dehydrogenase E2 component (dihydrolipoamide acetyltransferase)